MRIWSIKASFAFLILFYHFEILFINETTSPYAILYRHERLWGRSFVILHRTLSFLWKPLNIPVAEPAILPSELMNNLHSCLLQDHFIRNSANVATLYVAVILSETCSCILNAWHVVDSLFRMNSRQFTSMRFILYRLSPSQQLTNSHMSLWLAYRFGIMKRVQVGKDQEKAQSEKDSHSKNRGGKKPN